MMCQGWASPICIKRAEAAWLVTTDVAGFRAEHRPLCTKCTNAIPSKFIEKKVRLR